MYRCSDVTWTGTVHNNLLRRRTQIEPILYTIEINHTWTIVLGFRCIMRARSLEIYSACLRHIYSCCSRTISSAWICHRDREKYSSRIRHATQQTWIIRIWRRILWMFPHCQHCEFVPVSSREEVQRGAICQIALRMKWRKIFRKVTDFKPIDREPIDGKVHHHFEHIRRKISMFHLQGRQKGTE